MSKKIHIPDEVLRFFKQIDDSKASSEMDLPRLVKLNSENIQEVALASRKALGITQSTVSELAGITLSTVQKIEHGDLKVNLQNFLKTMDVLGIEVCLKKK